MRRTKIVIFPLFESEQVFGPPDEPVHVTSCADCFLSASASGLISLYSPGGPTQGHARLLSSFASLSHTIWSMEYAPPSDAILTLESKSSSPESSTPTRVARLYLKWRHSSIHNPSSEPDPNPNPTHGAAFSFPPHGNESPIALAACPSNPIVAIASSSLISLWDISLPHHPEWEPTCIALIETPNNLVTLDLFHSHLVFATPDSAFVYRFQFNHNPSSSPDAHPTPTHYTLAELIESENSSSSLIHTPSSNVFTFDARGNCIPKPGISIIGSPSSLPSPPHHASRQNSVSWEIGESEPSHTLRVQTENGYTVALWTKLASISHATGFDIHSVQIVPEYTARPSPGLSSKPVRVLVSGTRVGFLLGLLPDGTGNVLAEYAFTSPSMSAFATDVFLHVATSNGMETWTLRGDDAGMGASYPPPIVAGMQSFLGVRAFARAGDSIITVCAEGGGSVSATGARIPAEAWNLYILHPASLPKIVNDMAARTMTHAEPNPDMYFLLLLESYVLVQTSLAASKSVSWSSLGDALAAIEVDPDADLASAITTRMQVSTLSALLAKASGLLAAFQLAQGNAPSALHFLSQSDLSLSQGLDLIEAHLGHAPPETIPYYLDVLLFTPSLVQRVDADALLGDRILDVYIEHDPASLGSVVLHSCLHEYLPSRVIDALEGLDTRSDPHWLALSLLRLDTGDSEGAADALRAISPDFLSPYLIEHPRFFAELPQTDKDQTWIRLLRDVAPSLVLDTAVHLVTSSPNPLSSPNLARLESLLSLVGQPDDIQVLESLLCSPHLLHSSTATTRLSNLATRLAHRYIDIIPTAAAVHDDDGDGGGSGDDAKCLFGAIPDWMVEASRVDGDDERPSSLCHNTPTASLASLLTSPSHLLDTEAFAALLDALTSLDADATTAGLLVLRVFCAFKSHRVERALQDMSVLGSMCASAPVTMGSALFESEGVEMWLDLLTALQQHHHQTHGDADGGGNDVGPPAQAVYAYLAKHLDPPAFLALLPPTASLSTFFPLISHSITHHHSSLLSQGMFSPPP